MRICIAYDCIYPHTIGGAERWYRNLAERLAADGHEVTYATLRQWDRDDPPRIDGVEVVAVGPRMQLYHQGRRRIAPPLVFGAGMLAFLARRGRSFDAVHMASFPYFSLLAARLLRRPLGLRLVVDWHEVWTREYWREYLGAVGGWVGWMVQRACVRTPHRAFCFSQLHRRRLREEGFSGDATVLEGEYAGSLEPAEPVPARPAIVFAGRHIPEKRVPALVPAFERARQRLPELRLEIYGDGPDRPELLELIDRRGLGDVVSAPGFVDGDAVEEALHSALCMVLPSRREGYGLVVVEASALATPSVVVADPDNAATELVDDGENGVVAPSADPDALAEAILRVHDAGRPLRESTADWFRRNAQRLSIAGSLERVAASYSERGAAAVPADAVGVAAPPSARR